MRLKFLLFFVILGSNLALGDGCYIPARAMAKIPTITSQKAYLDYRDGVERMIISSELDSASQELGWIVPVPNEPSRIQKVEPGLFSTLNVNTGPKLIHDLKALTVLLFFACLVLNCLFRIYLFPTSKRQEESLKSLAYFVIIAGVLITITVPVVGVSSQTATDVSLGVQLHRHVSAGNYDVKVISAQKYEDLNNWLLANELAEFPKKGKEIVTDYINKNWYFVCIKLKRSEAGHNTPHPISMYFKSDKLIYPMRLTTLSGNSPYFEIYTCADYKVENKWLDIDFCDQIQRSKESRFSYSSGLNDEDERFSHYYRGESSEFEIFKGRYCKRKLNMSGKVLTKHKGSIDMNEINEDLIFEPVPFSYERHIMWTPQGLGLTMFNGLLVTLSVGMGFFTLGGGLFRRMDKFAIYYKKFEKVTALSIILAGLVIYYGFTIKNYRVSTFYLPGGIEVQSHVHKWAKENQELIGRGKHESFFKSLCKYLKNKKMTKNEFTGQNIVYERSPGNFMLVINKRKREVVIEYYQQNGRPRTVWKQSL